jgi:hypothetical protein
MSKLSTLFKMFYLRYWCSGTYALALENQSGRVEEADRRSLPVPAAFGRRSASLLLFPSVKLTAYLHLESDEWIQELYKMRTIKNSEFRLQQIWPHKSLVRVWFWWFMTTWSCSEHAISSSLILVIRDNMIIETNHIVLACLCRHF